MGAHPSIGSAFTSKEVIRKFAKLDGYLAEFGRSPDSVLRSHFTMTLVLARRDVVGGDDYQLVTTTDSSTSPASLVAEEETRRLDEVDELVCYRIGVPIAERAARES